MRGHFRLADPEVHPSADRLEAIGDRLEKLKTGAEEPPHMKKDYAQANLAWRMVIELVAGLGIGFGVGYGLDRLFGTMPLFLVIFVLLGLAAGVKTMLSSAKEIEVQMAAKAAEGETKQAAQAAGQEEDRRGD
ncbi:MAG TPA: F0F1 ATP synthase subunit I [Rhodobacteraceae bacterium]|nr:F0F1 ATP synthase subunit I [Paracoccaceae bacterium]